MTLASLVHSSPSFYLHTVYRRVTQKSWIALRAAITPILAVFCSDIGLPLIVPTDYVSIFFEVPSYMDTDHFKVASVLKNPLLSERNTSPSFSWAIRILLEFPYPTFFLFLCFEIQLTKGKGHFSFHNVVIVHTLEFHFIGKKSLQNSPRNSSYSLIYAFSTYSYPSEGSSICSSLLRMEAWLWSLLWPRGTLQMWAEVCEVFALVFGTKRAICVHKSKLACWRGVRVGVVEWCAEMLFHISQWHCLRSGSPFLTIVWKYLHT